MSESLGSCRCCLAYVFSELVGEEVHWDAGAKLSALAFRGGGPWLAFLERHVCVLVGGCGACQQRGGRGWCLEPSFRSAARLRKEDVGGMQFSAAANICACGVGRTNCAGGRHRVAMQRTHPESGSSRDITVTMCCMLLLMWKEAVEPIPHFELQQRFMSHLLLIPHKAISLRFVPEGRYAEVLITPTWTRSMTADERLEPRTPASREHSGVLYVRMVPNHWYRLLRGDFGTSFYLDRFES